jgi:hypothetical protein
MFQVTFLGNHGWLISSGASRLLVDPLFFPRYGLTESVELRVYPPCSFDFSKLAGVQGVLLTHEHEGHFDIPSLQLLDRKITIYVSSLSSVAMRQILKEMGFTVHLVRPGSGFSVGALEIITMPSDQETAVGEEWDNIPYLVYDKNGHGNFFTHVDVRPTAAMWEEVKKFVKKPGIWAYSNNYSQWHFIYSWASPEPYSAYEFTKWIFEYHKDLKENWEAPEGIAFIGGGFSFGGEREWINQEVFPCDSNDIRKIFSLLSPKEKFYTPIPGTTFTMKDSSLLSVEDKTDFLKALPKENWPSRHYKGSVDWIEAYSPATQITEFPESQLPLLEKELARFAGFLYAQVPFRSFYSLHKSQYEDKKPTLALLLLADDKGSAYVYEYDIRDCKFKLSASEDPVSEYLYVYECFASDMFAFLRSEISSASLSLGRCRHWVSEIELFDLDYFLMLYNHPLRNPGKFLQLYQKTAKVNNCEVQIKSE